MAAFLFGDGPNTFIPYWSAKELRLWFAEQEWRSKNCPGCYPHSLWWRDWIAAEMRKRRLKDAPVPLSHKQRRRRIAYTRKIASRETLRFTKILIYVDGTTKMG